MFRLKRIIIQRHPIFNFVDLSFDTYSTNVQTCGSSIAVLIGKNGVGKSYLLRAVIEIFRTVECLLKAEYDESGIPDLQFQFSVVYRIDEHEYSITEDPSKRRPIGFYLPGSFVYSVDGVETHWKQMRMPNAMIASSMTIADKFPTPSMGKYKYRGVRSEKTPSTTGTRTIVRKAVDGIMESLANKHTTREELSLLLNELGFSDCLKIRYRFRYKNIFLREDMTPELLSDIYTNWRKYFEGRSGEVWGAKYYRSLVRRHPDKIEIICSFLRQCAVNSDVYDNNGLLYDVFDTNTTLICDFEAIKLLSSLDLLSFPEFKVHKMHSVTEYDFVDSSSGETQQLCQFISIMSAIEPNSLVLIDEPENSSHPNWQISYITWLQRIFTAYKDCHFLIATHSHFILSDMNPVWSNIIALEKTEAGLCNIAEGVNTFGWSTDDILYRVFRVRNTRNYAFENDIIKLYSLISDGKQKSEEAMMLSYRLRRYVLPDGDPLLKLLDMLENA